VHVTGLFFFPKGALGIFYAYVMLADMAAILD